MNCCAPHWVAGEIQILAPRKFNQVPVEAARLKVVSSTGVSDVTIAESATGLTMVTLRPSIAEALRLVEDAITFDVSRAVTAL